MCISSSRNWVSRGRQADGATGLHRRRQPDAVPEGALRARAVHPGRSRRAMRPAAAGRGNRLRPTAFDQVILGCVNVIADEMNPARVAALRLGMGEKMVAFTVQINCGSGMQSIDTGLPLYPRGQGRPDPGRRRRSAQPRAAGLAAAGRALVRRPCRRQGHVVAKLAALAKARPSFFKPIIGLERGLTDPITDLNMGQTAEMVGASLRHHPRAVGHLCRRKPQAARQCAGAGLAQGRGRNRLRPRRQVLRPRRRRAAGLHGRDAGEAQAGVRAAVGQGHAGNSSQITDGASWVILASEEAVVKHGLTPKAAIVDSQWSALDPSHHGPRPGAVGDRTSEAQRIVARRHRDLGIERGFCDAGARLPRRLERRKILPRDLGPRRRRRADRPRTSSMSTAAPSASAIRSAPAATASCCISSTR